MRMRLLRRILIPVAAIGLASMLGVFVLGRTSDATVPHTNSTNWRLASSVSESLRAQIAAGKVLFSIHCSSCHGNEAQGSDLAPNLRGKGGATVHLWLSTGWMPLKTPTAQPEPKPPIFDAQQIDEVVAYVSSLAPGGVAVPTASELDLSGASRANGFNLFSLNCAPCHTITGAGDALAEGYKAPPLHGVTTQQIYEAVRTGPGTMPVFGPNQIPESELKDLMAYVTKDIEHPSSPGGLSLGGVGPVAEGFVGLFAGVGACLLAAYWVGDRTEKEKGEHGRHAEGGTEQAATEGAGGAHA